jgi:MarR family transcriptional regulator, negative regulator of the multidrug operon emrRAB
VSHAYERRTANLLGALALALADELQEAAADVAGHGASGPAALVLLADLAGGATVEELRRALGLTHSGTVRLVDRLVASGLVERRVGADARSLSLHLTPAGGRTARRVLTARETVLERALIALEPRRRVQLEGLLASLVAELGAPRRRICRLCDAPSCGRCPAEVIPST